MSQNLLSNEKDKQKLGWIKERRHLHEAFFITVSLIAAFLFRLVLIPAESVIGWDGVYYAQLGEKIISGNFYDGVSAYWSPLYSLLVGVSSLFFRDSEMAGRIVSLIAGVLLVIPVYYLIRDFYGQIPAYIGVILVIIHPGLIRSSMWVMTESLYTLIFTAGLLIFWYALCGLESRNFFLTGVLFGLAYLLKPEVIGFLGLLFILLIGLKIVNRKISNRSLLKNYLLLLLGFSIFFLPYVAFLYQKTGRLTISQKLLNNFTAVDYGKGSLEIMDNGQMTMKDQLFGDHYGIEEQPRERTNSAQTVSTQSPSVSLRFNGFLLTVNNNLKKLIKYYTPELFPFYLFFLSLIILGFFYRPWTRWRARKEIYLLAFFVCTYLGYAATVIQVRYLYPLLPIIVAWVANGIFQLSDWTAKTISNSRPRKKIDQGWVLIFAVVVISVALIFSIPSQIALEHPENLPFEEKRAGLWLKETSDKPLLVMAHSPIVAYYAGANHIFVPNEHIEDVLEYARYKKVDYLVFSERRFTDTPKIVFDNQNGLLQQLKLVYKKDESEHHTIFIYQITN